MITCKSYSNVITYFTSLNLIYCLCIIPDHDTYENLTVPINSNDWMEQQIIKSGIPACF